MTPRLVVVGGILASGKSSLAERLARALGAVYLGADAVRAELHGAGHQDAYVPGFSEKLYPELLRRAAVALGAGAPVVLDGSFRTRALRAAARELAAERGAAFLFVECRVPVSVARERLRERERSGGGTGWLAMLDAFLERWEAVEELPPAEHALVDGTLPVEESVGWLTQGAGLASGAPAPS